MLDLSFKTPLQTILCLGAHPDDIEIGCGATLLTLMRKYENLSVKWIVFSAHGQRAIEARQSAELFLAKVDRRDVEMKEFKDGFFPYDGKEIKLYFEELKSQISPDIIFTHYRDDLHQDHRLVSELTWNTFRNHLVLEYEIPKYDGDMGSPNVFFHVNREQGDQKIELLMTAFASQRSKHWFTEDLFRSMLRIRGMESNSPSTLAEAFYCRKLYLQ
ncbi:PIG-L family deacetylase [candidate division KSB1 bacterium]|nr:PIG-L family deacetylase [candidate division KSB1 bacterium]